jgi:hypothetical protein
LNPDSIPRVLDFLRADDARTGKGREKSSAISPGGTFQEPDSTRASRPVRPSRQELSNRNPPQRDDATENQKPSNRRLNAPEFGA